MSKNLNVYKLNRRLEEMGIQVQFFKTKTRFRVLELDQIYRGAEYTKNPFLYLKQKQLMAMVPTDFIESCNYKELTPENKSRLVAAIRSVWDDIAYDSLQLHPDHYMTAEEIRDVVADYVYRESTDWEEFSHEDQEIVLREAITRSESL
jgi:hypothetical protein